MDEMDSGNISDVVKEFFIEGHKLTIYACYEPDFGWSLHVENETGLSTNWHEFFPSANEAIDTALRAINEEGVSEFTECKEFGYLQEDNNN